MQTFNDHVSDLAHSDNSVVSKSVVDIVGMAELRMLLRNLNDEGLTVDRLVSSCAVGDFINIPCFLLWGVAYDDDDLDYKFCANWRLQGVDGWVLDGIRIADY